MKFAVIGSNSFTGSWMINELLNDSSNTVLGISRTWEKSDLYLPYKRNPNVSDKNSRFEFALCDIYYNHLFLMRALDDYRPECVVNYAAETEVYQSHLTPAEYFETNTLAVVNLCQELSKRGYLKRYVHISSAEVYGPCHFPVKETTPPNPTTPYAVSKLAADMFLLTLFKHCGFPVIIIRSTNVYGKHQQLYKIIPRSIIRLLLGDQIELHDSGSFIRPFIHVKDACSGVIAAIQSGSVGKIYNFTADCNMSVAEVVRLICKKLDYDYKTCTVSVRERTGHDIRYWLDDSRARAELNWQPRISFEDGVDEVIAWIKENIGEVQKEPLVYSHRR